MAIVKLNNVKSVMIVNFASDILRKITSFFNLLQNKSMNILLKLKHKNLIFLIMKLSLKYKQIFWGTLNLI